MLLNLSNHPSKLWSQEQQKAAEEAYQKIQDLPFPPIDPKSTSAAIQQLALGYCKKIIRLKPQAVHLMGEMTFTYALVRLLQTQGIICIASTSERKVITEENGKKMVLFEFEQFRVYPF
jgi:hypothetical protein